MCVGFVFGGWLIVDRAARRSLAVVVSAEGLPYAHAARPLCLSDVTQHRHELRLDTGVRHHLGIIRVQCTLLIIEYALTFQIKAMRDADRAKL